MEKMDAFQNGNEVSEKKNLLTVDGLIKVKQQADEEKVNPSQILKNEGMNGVIKLPIMGKSMRERLSIAYSLFSNLAFQVGVKNSKEVDAVEMVNNLSDGKDPVDEVKEETVIKDCIIEIVAKKNEQGEIASVTPHVLINGKAIRLKDIDGIYVDLDREVKHATVDEVLAREFDIKKYSKQKLEQMKDAYELDLDYAVIDKIPNNFKYMMTVCYFLDKGVNIYDYVNNKTPQEVVEYLINVAEEKASVISKLDLTRSVDLLRADFTAYSNDIDPFKVYEKTDSFEVASQKIIKFLDERNKTIYVNTYIKDNSAICDIEKGYLNEIEGLREVNKILADKENKGRLKYISLAESMAAVNRLGIFKLPEDVEVCDEMLPNLMIAVSTSNVLYKVTKAENGKYFVGDYEVPNKDIEGLYLEVLPITETAKKNILAAEESHMPTKIAYNINASNLKTMSPVNSLGDVKGSMLPFKQFKKTLENTYQALDYLTVDLGMDKEDKELALVLFSDFIVTAKFYDKSYGFREVKSRLITTKGKVGFNSKVKFADMTIPSGKFVELKVHHKEDMYDEVLYSRKLLALEAQRLANKQ